MAAVIVTMVTVLVTMATVLVTMVNVLVTMHGYCSYSYWFTFSGRYSLVSSLGTIPSGEKRAGVFMRFHSKGPFTDKTNGR